MVRLADIVRFGEIEAKAHCDLVLDDQMPVQEALQQMEEAGCEFVSINSMGAGKKLMLSKESLLRGILWELENTQQKLTEVERKFEGLLTDQLDMVHESVRSLAERENDKLEAVIENMGEGIIIFDRHGEIEKANPAAKKMFGLKGDKETNALADAIDKIGLRDMFTGTTADRKQHEFKVKGPDESVLFMRWTEIHDESEGFVGNVVMIRDITEEMSAEKAKSDFIAAISHELRTPLTGIQNSISNLLAGVTGRLGRKTQKYLFTMEGDCKRFVILVNDLLDLAKLEAGSMLIERRVMNIVKVVNNVKKEFGKEAKVRGITLTCETDGCISPVYADSQRIGQVLRHLMVNAMKFTDDHGKVYVRSYDSGDKVIIEVEDTGVGISLDLQKQIFNKFYQISRQAGPGYRGSGLGLTICNGIVAAHGGSIWVESQVGKGSTFYFSLPKTNPCVVLNKHISGLAKLADDGGHKFAMIVVKFDTPSGMRKHLNDAIGNMINELLIDSSHFMADRNDLTIQMNGSEMAFVVSGGEKRHIEAVEHKIRKIVGNRLKKYCNDGTIMPMMGIGMYPDDKCEVCNLEKIAWERMKKMTPVLTTSAAR